MLKEALRGIGVDVSRLQVALELPTNEAVRAAVDASLGVTALSGSAAASALEAVLLVQALLTLPERTFTLVLPVDQCAKQ